MPAAAPVSPHALTGPHADAAATARTDLTGGAAGTVTSETLPNGVRLIIAERPGAHSTKVQVGVGAGSLQDPAGKLGLAHLLEHLTFEGSPTHSASQQEKIRNGMGGMWNAYTDRDSIVFYGVAPKKDATTAATMLTDMFKHPKTVAGASFEQERAAVKNEMIYYDSSLAGEVDNVAERLVFGEHPLTNTIIGTRGSVDRIVPADLRTFHQQYFTGRNTVALVEGDPKSLPLDTLRRELGQLPAGARVDNDSDHAPVIPGQAMQVINDPSSGTVQLNVLLPIENAKLDKMKTPPKLLLSELGDVLNNRLRRTKDLTYGVDVKLDPADESSDPTHSILSISTSVFPENAEKMLTSLVSTLQDGADGFGAKTFDLAKKGLLARIASKDVTQPTITDRAEDAFQSALQTAGVEIPPATAPAAKLGKIRNASAKDFAHDAGTLLNLSNMKLLATGPIADTGTALRGALREAGINTRKMQINPVDLTTYRDAGTPIPKRHPAR